MATNVKAGWKRVKEAESPVIIGHWEHPSGSLITLTKGVAHIVHKGKVVAVYTKEEAYGTNPNTIAKMVTRRIGLADSEDSTVFD